MSLVDLIAAKAAPGRPQDLADLDVLERVAARRGGADARDTRPPRRPTKAKATGAANRG